jgi:hypothetical protein
VSIPAAARQRITAATATGREDELMSDDASALHGTGIIPAGVR